MKLRQPYLVPIVVRLERSEEVAHSNGPQPNVSYGANVDTDQCSYPLLEAGVRAVELTLASNKYTLRRVAMMKNEISIPAGPAEINGNGFRPRILRDRSMDCRSYDVDHAATRTELVAPV